MKPRVKASAVLLAAGLLAAPTAIAKPPGSEGTQTGPSSSQSPYLVPLQDGVITRSILSVGDSVNEDPDRPGTPYRMVGIPDGLGVYKNRGRTFTILMNHELPPTSGVVRAHGARGAFVSRWVVDRHSLRVLHGEDLIKQTATYNKATGTYNPLAKGVAFSRFCSADLAARSAYYDKRSKLGYPGRIFTNGEETATIGRAFAHLTGGDSYELASMGQMAFENVVSNPATGRKTVTAVTDDTTPGQVYVHFGDKRATGNPVERAGLTDGALYGIKVPTMRDEATQYTDGPKPFTLEPLGDQSRKTGAELEAQSDAQGVTEFFRPEDAHWDPVNPNVLYFATTANFTAPSKLWKATFADPSDPSKGGTIEAVLNGSEGQKMLDNLTVNGNGQALLQEDPGAQEYLAKVRLYDSATDTQTAVAEHDPERFQTGGSKFITNDEESSGIIGASRVLGQGWYLADVQAHRANPDPELVEEGQLLALKVPDSGGKGQGEGGGIGHGHDDVGHHGGGRGRD